MLVVALFFMRARRISRRLAPFAVAVGVIVAIGFVHRSRREMRAAKAYVRGTPDWRHNARSAS